MAPQPTESWNVLVGVNGSVPASMLAGLARLQLQFTTNSTASLGFPDPITMDEVLSDNFKAKVVATPECIQQIKDRQVDLIQGIIKASEQWSWTAGTMAKAAGPNA